MATAEEENFPRGGVSRKRTIKQPSNKYTDDLFKDGDATPKKPKKRKSFEKNDVKGSKKQKVEIEVSFKPNAGHIELLSPKSICPGLLTLAVVKDVHDYELVVSLPNGLFGTVPITSISNAYTSLLKKIADESLSTDEDVKSLHEMFDVGQVVRCRVLEVNTRKGGKLTAKLSMKPSDVNANLLASSLKTGQVLCGTVVSQEDHGYVIDLGIKGVHTFLRNDDAEKFIQMCNDGFPLKVGQYLHCWVQTTDHIGMLAKESRSVHVTIDPTKIAASKVTANMKLALTSLVPGMVVNAQVEKVTKEGLKVEFFSYKAAIHSSHLSKSLQDYEAQQKVKACILFINPATKLVCLTLLPHLYSNPTKPCSLFRAVEYGDIIEEAEVLCMEKGRGVKFQLTDTVRGFAAVRNLSDKHLKDVNSQFVTGDKHRCRIVGFDLVDAVAIVSLNQSVLTRTFMKITDVKLGSVVECTIQGFYPGGMSVTVAKHMKGFVPSLHLADVPIKHPEKKYKLEQKIKCRVLQIDKGKSKLVLTNKRSLVNSDLPVITSYDQIEAGMEVEGFIVAIKQNGVLVAFYNNVKGWVNKDELGTEKVLYPEKVFYIGQVVRCRVKSFKSEESKIYLSFKLSGGALASKHQKHTPPPTDFAIGKVVDCKVVRKTDNGLDVMILSSDTPAYLPKLHLSDSLENCNQFLQVYEAGDVIKEVMYLSHTSQTIITHKYSFIQASRDGSLVSEFSAIQPGLQLPGSVKNIMEYGVFVEFPGGMIGLAPNKFICEKKLDNISAEFPVGTSVSAKVLQIHEEKSRFLVSLRLSDCYHGNSENMVDIMSTMLMEKFEICEGYQQKKGKASKTLSHLSSLAIGQVVPVTVTDQSQYTVSCDLGHGVKGNCSKDIIEGYIETDVGSEQEAVILNVNLQDTTADVSLNNELVTAAKHKKDNRFTKVKSGQRIKGEIILIKSDFVVVALRGHATGTFAHLPIRKVFPYIKVDETDSPISVKERYGIIKIRYLTDRPLPIRKHLNDVLEKYKLSLGEIKTVVVKNVEKGFIIGNWAENEKTGEGTDGDQTYDIRKPNLQLGTIAKALVKAVHDLQMNVIIRNSPGRVHITQVPDNTVVGSFPLQKYKKTVGQRISVKVVGFREVKSHKYLPISHSHSTKAVPECSLIPSVLEKHGIQAGEEIVEKSFSVGDKVIAYVDHFTAHDLWFVVTPSVRGRAQILNLSSDVKTLENHTEEFKAGQVCEGTVIQVLDGSLLELSLIGLPNEIKAGCLATGVISGKTQNEAALNVRLYGNCLGRVWYTDVMDRYSDNPLQSYSDGQYIRCRVLSCEEDSKGRRVCSLSLRPSRCKAKPQKKNRVLDADIQSLSELQDGQIMRGFVIKHCNFGITVCLGHAVTGLVSYKKVSEVFVRDPQLLYPPGKVVTVQILSIDTESEKIQLSMLERDTGVALDFSDDLHEEKLGRSRQVMKASKHDNTKKINVKRKHDTEDGIVQKKRKLVKAKVCDTGVTAGSDKGDETLPVSDVQSDDSDSENVSSDEVPKSPADKSLPRLQVPEEFTWDVDFSTPAPPSGQGERSSDSEDDSLEQAKKSSRKSKKAILKERQAEEKRLFELEREKLHGDQQPQTAEDFDRLVLESPNSSLVWLRYVAYHLEMTEIEKARGVAERALQIISFREEQEKLNIWVGYLNMENMYGTEDSLNAVLKRALQQNEPLSVYQQLINIYIKSSKIEEAEKVYHTLTKKFSCSKDVWVKFGMFYFKNDKAEAGRKLLQRSLKSLTKRDHLEVISKFAQLEFKFGESERGKTMFENILSNYPKRTDLWSVYIDMVVKLGQTDQARQLYERVINLKLSVKKMKFFFKRYLDFEKSFGSEEMATAVKQKALEYVESRGGLEELED